MKRVITPVTLIREKDKAKIVSTLFKVKLFALVGHKMELVLRTFLLGISRVTVLKTLQQILSVKY